MKTYKIICPNCKQDFKIGHLEWSALKCLKCKGYFIKHKWLEL